MRKQSGSQLAEFGPALIILVAVILIPMLDLGILPIRWMLAQEIVNDYARQLAIAETFSQSFQKMEADPSLADRLQKLGGVTIKSIHLRLRVARIFRTPHIPEFILVEKPGKMPEPWQPDGEKAPCSYTLEVEVRSLISPAFLFPTLWYAVPGINTPVPIILTANHEWENLGRNPVTRGYFLNE